MELDSELTQVLGALVKADNLFPFKKLTSRGGNEESIDGVVELLRRVVEGKRARRVHLFLVLNSELEAVDALVDDDGVGHLARIAPAAIPECLLAHLAWGLRLDRYYCECVERSHPCLRVSLLRVAADHMKHRTPAECSKAVRELALAAYKAELRLRSGSGASYDAVCRLVAFYKDPPCKSKMAHWSGDKRRVFTGTVVFNLFGLMNDCFEAFAGKSRVDDDDDDGEKAIYDAIGGGIAPEEKSIAIDDVISKLNDLFFETAKCILSEVNVDVFCSWCEPFEDDSEKTLQQAIGERAYKLNSLMESDSRLNNDLSSMLKAIACKPSELKDTIAKADRSTLLQKANEQSEDQIHWLTALTRMNNVFDDEQSLKCLMANSSVLPIKDIQRLFKSSVDFLYDKDGEYSMVKMLAMDCFTKMNLDEKKSILMEVFSDKAMTNCLELDEYDQRFTEILNKFVHINDELLSSLLDLFVQNPFKFYAKIFKECSKNTKMHIFLPTLKHFKEFYHINYANDTNGKSTTDLMSTILLVLMEIPLDCRSTSDKEDFVHFLKEIINNEIVDNETLLTDFIMPNVEKYLTKPDLRNLHLFLICLRVFYYPDKLEEYVTPVLAMCGQILESNRWDLRTFSAEALDVVQETINIQQSVFPYIARKKKPSDPEWKFLINKLSQLSPINLIYYRALYQKPLDIIDTNANGDELKICLTFLLPRSTLEEWRNLYSLISDRHSSAESFKMLCDITHLVSRGAKEINSDNSYGCLEHCFRNLSIIFTDIINKDDLNEDLPLLLENIFKLHNSVPNMMRDGCFTNIMTVTNVIKNKIDSAEDLKTTFEAIKILENVQEQDMLNKILNRK